VKVLVTGAAGFIGGYAIADLLEQGWDVVGLDDLSKYGPVRRGFDGHARYRFVEGDARDVDLLGRLLDDCDHFLAAAAMVGGIGYFHELPYDLLATNERLTASAFDAAIRAHRAGRLRKITVVSSSMVYESTERFPSEEGDELRSPPPRSSYGFQKLAVEYFARAARDQHGLSFTIARPFNCVGVGEGAARRAVEGENGNVRLATSHVVPDLVRRALSGETPLSILGDGSQVRCYTYGGDVARGLRLCLERPEAEGEDFNLSSAVPTTVLDLARLVWEKTRPGEPFAWRSAPPFPNDVQRRLPSVAKAARVLGFEAKTSLSEMLDEVIPWMKDALASGAI